VKSRFDIAEAAAFAKELGIDISTEAFDLESRAWGSR